MLLALSALVAEGVTVTAEDVTVAEGVPIAHGFLPPDDAYTPAAYALPEGRGMGTRLAPVVLTVRGSAAPAPRGSGEAGGEAEGGPAGAGGAFEAAGSPAVAARAHLFYQPDEGDADE